MKTASTAGIRYAHAGSGAQVLLVQGVGVAGCGWAPQVAALCPHYSVAWFDNRGVGESTGRPGTLRDMATDAFAVMDTLGWRSAHVVGHSLGGVIAQQMAVMHPERVDRMALLCTFARGRTTLQLDPASICRTVRTIVGTRAMRRRAFHAMVSPPSIPPAEAHIDQLESAFGRALCDLPPAAMAQVRTLVRSDLRAALSAVDIPTLVVSATHDHVAPVSEGPILAEALRGRFVEVPGGHAVTVQDPDRINALLVDFLTNTSSPDRTD